MATVMGGVGYGLYFVAKVTFSSTELFSAMLIRIAIRLPYNCTAYSAAIRIR